jgi:hypothetical protein
MAVCFAFTASVSMAEEEKKANYFLEGTIDSYFKVQEDYNTPLDELGSVRQGANNRSKQSIRTQGLLRFISTAGKNRSNGTDWYSWIGVATLKADSADPDQNNIGKDKDGGQENRTDKIAINDTWVRYSPHIAVGVKIGTQTVKGTANGAVTHLFQGDADDDFVMYTAGAIANLPGISVDLHLSKDIEFGIGAFEGMNDASAIATSASGDEALTTAAWSTGKASIIEWTVGYQNVAVGGYDTEDDPPRTSFAREYVHSVINAALKLDFGIVAPFVGIQMIAGEHPTSTKPGSTEPKEIEASLTTAGLEANIGPGQLAMEVTVAATDEFDATNDNSNVAALSELDYAAHVSYEIPMSEGSTLSFFAYNLAAKEDDGLHSKLDETKATLKTLQSAEAAIAAGQDVPVTASGGVAAGGIDLLKAGISTLENLRWTSTNSVGVAFRMKFK